MVISHSDVKVYQRVYPALVTAKPQPGLCGGSLKCYPKSYKSLDRFVVLKSIGLGVPKHVAYEWAHLILAVHMCGCGVLKTSLDDRNLF